MKVGWEITDKYLVTAFTPDCVIRVWESTSGDLVKKLTVRQYPPCPSNYCSIGRTTVAAVNLTG